MKRILIVTQYIYPKPFKSSEMAFEMMKRGYKVGCVDKDPWNYGIRELRSDKMI